MTDASPPTVLAILVADAPAEPMRAVETARAVAGRGLEGDRYHDGRGTFLKPGDRGDAPGADPDVPGRHQVTLIEAGVLREAVPGEPAETTALWARRNVVVEGLELRPLIGTRLRIGDVEVEALEDCPPCGHPEKLGAPAGFRVALGDRGGLRCAILTGGTLRVGDPVEPIRG